MATRQNSSSGNPKSPRVQVVLPEDLCNQLSALAKRESRTVSNMAKVLIQEGVQRLESKSITPSLETKAMTNKDKFISALEAQEPRRLRGAPKRLRFLRP
ncbi:ribbon-helix-helix domain-containing protein [Prochlorococcus sp. MIT 1223]|uniref:ribbon-helix-helix domain-containing protein n=1 Tax=Prochlorococcus sp. MIT 1223 TaxID=3096217 RepID=UPI002A757BC4|nr:hypothetical protein [Prochlorococcus sp. MIT 1223]